MARVAEGAATPALSYRHAKVQRLRRLVGRRSARDAEQVFVVEGATLLAEAHAAGASVESVYLAPGAEVDPALTAGVRIHELAPGVIERVAGTVSPQPVLAVVAMRWGRLGETRVGHDGPIIVCVDVRDPGNLGTVLRSAEASGACGVVCCDGTVDVYNPKCVRASAGAVFHVPLLAGGSPMSALETLGASGYRRLATAVGAGEPYDQADLAGQVAFVLGNEANGLPAGLEPVIDAAVHIPMQGRTESLNVGMACAVLCFEALRQRRQAHPRVSPV